MSNFPWVKGKEYDEIIYETYDGIAKITINRPECRNAFTPKTNIEMYDAFSIARDDASIGVIILTGANHDGRPEDQAFCSGGDQKKRGNGGYVGEDNIPRLNVLDLQRLIRVVPKPVIAMVNGYAIGGGNVLNYLCDLSIAAETAKFGQTGPRVGSFDGGYGASYLAAMVGQKKAREIWYLCRQYTAQEALDMGMILISSKKNAFLGLVKCWRCRLPLCASSRHLSMRQLMAMRVFSSSQVMLLCCITPPMKQKKDAMRLRKSASQTSSNSLSFRRIVRGVLSD